MHRTRTTSLGSLRPLVVASVILFAGCRSSGLVSADGDLRADPAQVDFGETQLDATARQSIQLTNSGQGSLAVTLETTAPFGVPPELTLSGGERRAVELTFSPSVLGAASAVLTVTARGARLTLGLRGTGVPALPCAASACLEASIDDTSTCVVSPKADGTACAEGCVVGNCAKGTCVGTLRSCDDGDPCTTDGCAPDGGCVHVPVACQATNPCSAGSCSAALGCTEAPVGDGLACGAADCVSALVCVSGQCVSRAVPDGAACGRQTPCQGAGRCVAQQCVQPPPVPLARAWSYSAPARHSLHGLVFDGLGNSFTADCLDAGPSLAQCALVSFGPTGTERWRTAFSHTTNTSHGPLNDALMLADTKVVSTIGPDWVDAVEASTGSIAWSFYTRLVPAANDWLRWAGVGFDGDDELILVYESHYTLSLGPGFTENRSNSNVAGIVASTGFVRHVSYFSPDVHVPSVVLEKHSGIFRDDFCGTSSACSSNVAMLSAFKPSTAPFIPTLVCTDCTADGGAVYTGDGNWELKWQRTYPTLDPAPEMVRAARGGQLLVTHPQYTHLISTADGAVISSALPVTTGIPSVVWGDTALFYTPQPCLVGPCYLLDVVAVDTRTQAVSRAALPSILWVSDLWLTQRDSALMALRPSQAPAELREIDSHGKLLMQCQLGLDPVRNPTSLPILSNGRYAMLTAVGADGHDAALEVWELPGYAPATSGWVSPRGGPGLDLKER